MSCMFIFNMVDIFRLNDRRKTMKKVTNYYIEFGMIDMEDETIMRKEFFTSKREYNKRLNSLINGAMNGEIYLKEYGEVDK